MLILVPRGRACKSLSFSSHWVAEFFVDVEASLVKVDDLEVSNWNGARLQYALDGDFKSQSEATCLHQL